LLAIVVLLVIAPLLYHLVMDQNPDEMKIKDVLVTNDQTNVLVYAKLSHFPPDIETALFSLEIPAGFTPLILNEE